MKEVKQTNPSIPTIRTKIQALAVKYAANLKVKIIERIKEMEADDDSHYLIYQVLGISDEEGKLVDEYQNKGRFLYKYAGSFLEEVAIMCFLEKFPKAESKMKILNTLGSRPKTFEIDCLVEKNAYEIKWRDATTDGDHITKEHTRLRNIQKAGYKPVRIMFYYPNRLQSKRVRDTISTIYKGVGGEYYYGDGAWGYIHEKTGIDLKKILTEIAEENTKQK